MACPPEDSKGLDGMGNKSYQEFLDKVLDAKAGASARDNRKFRELCASAAGLNYTDRYCGQTCCWLDQAMFVSLQERTAGQGSVPDSHHAWAA